MKPTAHSKVIQMIAKRTPPRSFWAAIAALLVTGCASLPDGCKFIPAAVAEHDGKEIVVHLVACDKAIE